MKATTSKVTKSLPSAPDSAAWITPEPEVEIVAVKATRASAEGWVVPE